MAGAADRTGRARHSLARSSKSVRGSVANHLLCINWYCFRQHSRRLRMGDLLVRSVQQLLYAVLDHHHVDAVRDDAERFDALVAGQTGAGRSFRVFWRTSRISCRSETRRHRARRADNSAGSVGDRLGLHDARSHVAVREPGRDAGTST